MIGQIDAHLRNSELPRIQISGFTEAQGSACQEEHKRCSGVEKRCKCGSRDHLSSITSFVRSSTESGPFAKPSCLPDFVLSHASKRQSQTLQGQQLECLMRAESPSSTAICSVENTKNTLAERRAMLMSSPQQSVSEVRCSHMLLLPP